MQEEWRDIPGYEGRYQASTLGNICNARTLKVLKPHVHYRGYLRVDLCIKNVCIHKFIHRLVALVFLPNYDGLAVVNHSNLDKKDNRPQNLEWMSYSDNTRHYYEHREEIAF